MKTNVIELGDAYELIKKIPDKSIDCIYTDIPYLYHLGKGGTTSELSQRINNKMNSISEISNGIDFKIFDDFRRVMNKVNLYIWCSKLQIQDILNYWLAIDNVYFEILVWNKTNPMPTISNSWLPDIEYCLYFREKGVVLNDGYENKAKAYSGAINQRDKRLYGHPTIKPLDLVQQHLLHTTQENDIVLDPFIGSGTTAEACKLTNRRYIGFELDKEYHEIAVNRLKGRTKSDIEQGITRLDIFDLEQQIKEQEK